MNKSKTTNETTELPTISIKGRDYVLVKDRISYFNETYQNGSIRTELVSDAWGKWVVKATVIPDVANPERSFTGYSQADEASSVINKQAGLENSETSAVGRALAMMGIGVIESVASADEMHKAGVGATIPAPKGSPLGDFTVAHVPKSDAEFIDKQFDNAKCETCGADTVYREGTTKAGKPYRALFCSTGERSHAQWLS